MSNTPAPSQSRVRMVDAILDKIECTATEASAIAGRLEEKLVDAITTGGADAVVECDADTLQSELETVREIAKQPGDKKAT